MARIVGIDFGLKRTGLSVTDPLQIIVSPLDAVLTKDLEPYLASYLQREEVEKFVIGDPSEGISLDHPLAKALKLFVQKLEKKYPQIPIAFQNEMFTSYEAKQAILKSGAKQKKRRDKALVDKISAVLILQYYLGHI